MASKKKRQSISELVNRFSKFDVIAEMEKEYQNANSKSLPLSLIDDNAYVKRVRWSKERIEAFGKSIGEKGIFSPLLVRKKRSHYELVLGRKRYYGAKAAGLLAVPAIVLETSDEEMLLMLLADTRDQRESNILEMAYIYEALTTKFKYSPQTLAQISHQSRSQVVNTMRLLNLPDQLIKEVSQGELSYGHARALLPLSQELILEVAKTIHRDGLSVRQTEALVKKLTIGERASPGPEVKVSGNSILLEFGSVAERDEFMHDHLSFLKEK